MNADGAVIIEADVNVGEAEKELAKLRKEIKKTEESIGKQEAKKAPLVQQAEELRKKMAAAKAEAKRYGELWKQGVVGADGDQTRATERYQQLSRELDAVATKIDKIDEELFPAQDSLERMKNRAGELNKEIGGATQNTEKMDKATKRAEKSAGKFANRLKSIVASAFIFNILSAALRAFTEWLGKAIKTSPEARNAIADLKGALLTLAQPLVGIIIPVFTTFVAILSRLITLIAKVVSFLFGKTADQSREAAKALNEQIDAMDGVGGAAKKAGKSLAGFDEINKLSGDSGGGASDLDIKPDLSGIQGAMREMEVYMSGALLALGALLTFSGVSVPLGLALMAAGAAGLGSALAVDWDSMPANLKNAIAKTMLVLGTAALVIGAILGFSGANVPLGMGLIMAGAGALGVAAASLDWNSIITALKGSMGPVVALLSGSLLAIGAILAFCGYMPLGIGLMAAGAIGLATTAALNWDSIVEALKGPVGGVVALVSGALLAIGAVLAFSGANLPLGIGLMAAGALGLASVVALNWDFITEKMQGKVGLVTAIASGALLALGLILLFTGAGAGLGLGLILAGAAGLATVVAFNWDFLCDKVKEIWGKVKTFWNTHIAQVFTKEWWLDLAKTCGNGLLAGFEKAINGIIWMFETMINWIVDKLNKIRFDVPDWVPGIGGKGFGFNIQNVKFGRVTMPRLATGAVIPPNREFMAILGDQKRGYNIEAPEDLIRQIVREESGGGMNTSLLQAILNAIKEGKVLMVGRDEFAKLVYSSNQEEAHRVGPSLTVTGG